MVRACWTNVGSGSERRASRPEAVAMGSRGRFWGVGLVLMGIASAVAMMMILSMLLIICFSVAVFVYQSLALLSVVM